MRTMELRQLMPILIIATFFSSSTATVICELNDRYDCVYTVLCEQYAGQAWTPECESDPYVTFIITKSTVDTLTAGFFGSTNFDSRVRVIKAIDNSWTQIESLSFRYYSKTLQMDLSGNKIENIKNEAFRNLITLESLNLSSNAIQNLNQRSFLISESKNTDLAILDLSNNLLSDLSEDLFNYIPSLQKLYLQNNRIVTLTEDSLINAKNLAILNLSHNKISALNMTLINLRSLKELDLSFNKIKQINGYELNRLVALEYVNMSHNSIETIESNCFNQAFNLLQIDLSYNRIKSPITNLMYINNNKLRYLNLYGNNITQIDDNAFLHNALESLILDKNNLTGEITAETFKGLKGVSSLNLSNQSISIIKSSAFADAEKLVNLNLSHNNIQLIENSSFAGALSLNILDVSYNNVSNIHFLRNSLENITELYLQNNSLVAILKGAFVSQKSMKKLDIANNMISNIEPDSFPLDSIQYLNITNNLLSVTIERNIFSPAKMLRFLDLSNFKLQKINEMALVDLPVVARVNISHNELEYIDPNNFLRMDNMYSLDLSYNKLPCFHLNNASLINLKALYLQNNNLQNISRTFINMTDLLYVDLSNNNISDLSEVPFEMLRNLKVLRLSRNYVKVFNTPQINRLTNLTDLILSGNQLKEIDLSYFRDLVLVDLGFNKLSLFNASFFKNLDSLQSVDLSGNNITQLIPGTFQSTKILKSLNLSYNQLSILRYGSFRGLNRTEVLDLSHNNLAYVDVDVFHECVELRRLIIDYNHLKSIDVDRLLITLPKLTALSVGGNPLSCKEIVRNMKIVNKNLFQQVEVTSIDKIYHEDNVHGIKCGDSNGVSTTVKAVVDEIVSNPSNTALVIWCSVLTLIVLAAVLVMYFYRKKNDDSFNRMQLRSSVSVFSENQHDLLG